MMFKSQVRDPLLESIPVFLLLSALCFGIASEVNAEEDLRRIVASRAPMTKSLGGGLAGELSLNTKVEVLEEKGSWTRVAVQGWVRSTTLSAPSLAKRAPAPVSAPKVIQGALRVTDYIRSSRTDINPPREYIILTIRNDSPKTVKAWSGLLVAVDDKDAPIFRERVSEEAVDWKPGQDREVTFFWEPSEEGFTSIQLVKQGEHKFALLNAELNNSGK